MSKYQVRISFETMKAAEMISVVRGYESAEKSLCNRNANSTELSRVIDYSVDDYYYKKQVQERKQCGCNDILLSRVDYGLYGIIYKDESSDILECTVISNRFDEGYRG